MLKLFEILLNLKLLFENVLHYTFFLSKYIYIYPLSIRATVRDILLTKVN